MAQSGRRPKGCVFDAYGTLFDFASAAEACRAELGDKTGALANLWRDKQLQYAWLRTLEGRYADFWQVTGDALDYALETLGLAGEPGLRERLMALYLTLDAFPDAGECLGRLKAAGIRTAILSNGSPDMLAPLVARSGLEPLIDQVLSVDAAQVFKTHPRAYQLALDALDAAAGELVFVSSNGWDAYGASAFGMQVAWCNRYGQRRERLPSPPAWEVRSLAELPDLVLAHG